MKLKVNNSIALFKNQRDRFPNKLALVFYPESKPLEYTFNQVFQIIHNLQGQLQKLNIRKNNRVLILAKPDHNFYFFSLAVMSIGATPIFIEPKKEKILKRISQANADTILLDEKLSAFKYLIPSFWKKTVLSFSKNSLGITLLNTDLVNKKPFYLEHMENSDPLLISYTTGSTGTPKAADRNYEISLNQYTISMKYWIHNDQDVDLTFFPNIIFQNLTSGVTTLLPRISKEGPDSINFKTLTERIKNYNVSRISSPPGYLNAFCNYLEESGINLPQIKKLIAGGASVGAGLAQKTITYFPNSECDIVYGSTEAEPISHISMKDFLSSKDIIGYNVGFPINEIKVKFLDSQTKSIEGDTGEILLSGAHVVKRYLNSSSDNKVFKYKDLDGTIWHKTGDMGYKLGNGQLVLLGRKSRPINLISGKVYSLSLEKKISLSLPRKNRVAVMENNSKLSVFIEGDISSDLKNQIVSSLSPDFKGEVLTFIVKKLPVDSRHHWKIDYGKL